MNLKELSSPIRMYWDIGVSGNSVIDYGRIAGEIASNKILSLQITESEEHLSDACRTILDVLKDRSVALSLVVPLPALNSAALEYLGSLPVRLLLVPLTSREKLHFIPPIVKQTRGKTVVGIAFSVTRSNFRELPDVLEFCIERNITSLVLPMQRLMPNGDSFRLSPVERQDLTTRLSKIEKPAWLKIIIHDPFLWRTFFPSVEFPEGGCQAANTMLFISPSGDVYPCPSLPINLGSLTERTLQEVIKSEGKRNVRKALLGNPAECSECKELNVCKGGCRGRAYVTDNSLAKADPACK